MDKKEFLNSVKENVILIAQGGGIMIVMFTFITLFMGAM